MEDPIFRELFSRDYTELLISELVLAMMSEDGKSVRKLAAVTQLSPTVIQRLRSGKQDDIRLKNFVAIAEACGYQLVLEKAGERLVLCGSKN